MIYGWHLSVVGLVVNGNLFSDNSVAIGVS